MTRVLVVDDDPVTVMILEAILQQHGYEVSCAFSGREGLEILAAEDVAIVLLDLVMEGLSGLEVLQEIRRKWDLLDLPVLIVSANHEPAPMVAALELGANDYLTKPVANELLLAKIHHHLSLKRKQPGPMMTPQDMLAPGARLGPFEILGLRGEGGMGRVYSALDRRLQRTVAIKLSSDSYTGESELARLGREAMALARISHPNVVTLHDIGSDPVPFLVMEFLDGSTLGNPKREFPLEVSEALRWTMEILEGIDAAHCQGVIHRDLKPENIMVTRSGRIKLMDFGVSRVVNPEEQLLASEICGTPAFMSPEQIDTCFGEIGPRSDLFSVAGILYFMLTGAPPFTSTHPSQLALSIVFREPESILSKNPEVSPELEAICLKGLRKDQASRFQTAAQFCEVLAGLRARSSAELLPGWLRPAPNAVAEMQSASLSPASLERLGPYKVLATIGQGQMATVFRALDTRNERVLALKVLRPEFLNDANFLERFEREIQIARQLRHHNLIEILDAGTSDGQQYLAMELADGLSLADILADGPLPLDDFPILAVQITAGLHYAHRQNLFHRDIKPDNIFVGRDALVKILDFGLAIESGQSRFTEVGYSMGTPDYMAPEGLTTGVSDEFTDQYSLGVVFYQMLTGRLPFSGATPVEVGLMHIKQMPVAPRLQRPEIPESWEQAILRMLSKQPQDRFPDLGCVRTILSSALADS